MSIIKVTERNLSNTAIEKHAVVICYLKDQKEHLKQLTDIFHSLVFTNGLSPLGETVEGLEAKTTDRISIISSTKLLTRSRQV